MPAPAAGARAISRTTNAATRIDQPVRIQGPPANRHIHGGNTSTIISSLAFWITLKSDLGENSLVIPGNFRKMVHASLANLERQIESCTRTASRRAGIAHHAFQMGRWAVPALRKPP